MSFEERLATGVAHVLLDLLYELLHFLTAHPTHLTVIVCVAIVARAMVATIAHARRIAVEMKTIEEQRETREIEADRDVQIAKTRAQERFATAKIRVADTERASRVTAEMEAEREAEAEEEEAREPKKMVRGGRGKRS